MEPVRLTPEQESEAERIADILLAKAQVEVRWMARLLASKENRELLSTHRVPVAGRLPPDRCGSGRCGARRAQKKGYRGSSLTCPCCRQSAKFVAYRRKGIMTLMGSALYERPYYHGCGCGGQAPTDRELGLQERLTPAAAEVTALHGNLEAFDEAAAKTLLKSTGLRVSASTVRRVTEGAGADLRERRVRGEIFGDQTAWAWHTDAAGQRCAYVSLDATGVRQQAPDAGPAEGRMPWVGEVFNPTSTHRPKRERVWNKRYLAGLMSLPEMGRQLRREALSVGIDQADVLIGLTDGGHGLEDCLLDQVFSGLGKPIEFILDFYHATEHVHQFIRMLHPSDEAAAKNQADGWCHTLRHEGGERLLAELEQCDLADRSPPVQKAHTELCNYVRKNLHRMDYPCYAARGWQIGSGSIESACKNVINARLNGPGMRWSEHGTDELAHLRALYKSESSAWDDYWSRRPVAAA